MDETRPSKVNEDNVPQPRGLAGKVMATRGREGSIAVGIR